MPLYFPLRPQFESELPRWPVAGYTPEEVLALTRTRPSPNSYCRRNEGLAALVTAFIEMRDTLARPSSGDAFAVSRGDLAMRMRVQGFAHLWPGFAVMEQHRVHEMLQAMTPTLMQAVYESIDKQFGGDDFVKAAGEAKAALPT